MDGEAWQATVHGVTKGRHERIDLALGLKPSQNPAWDLNPCGCNLNWAKTHGLPTEITDLVSRPNEPQILDLSSHKLFSERQ